MRTTSFIGDQRRAAQRRLMNIVIGIMTALFLVTCYIMASTLEFHEGELYEQLAADRACRAAGATAAVRVNDENISIFVCNQPVAGALARSAS